MSYSILLAEDNPLTREAIIQTIDWEQCGCKMIGASGNGLEAKRLLTSLHPDILISDIKIPGLSGIELARIALQENAALKVIFITGYQQFEYAHAAIRLGIADFILKPIKNEELFAAVKKQVQALNQLKEMGPTEDEIEASTVENYPFILKDILSYMAENYNQPLSLHLLSNHFNLNSSYISSLIKKHTGKNFVDIVTEQRMEKAKLLLQNSTLRINEIGNLVGFSDYAYFYQVFYKLAGMSPKEYRNNFCGTGGHRAEIVK